MEYIYYYFSKYESIELIEFLGLPVMLLIAWWAGKQYDKAKFFQQQESIQKIKLEKNIQLFQSIFEKAPIGIAIIDNNGRPIIANSKLQEMLGYSEEELGKMTLNEFSESDDAKKNMELLSDLLAGKIESYQLNKRYIRKDGQIVWGEVTSTLFPIEDPSFYVIGMVTDITKRMQAEQELRKAYQEMKHFSNRDGLTNIANRRYFDQYLNSEWERAKESSKPLSLIIVDIDFYKKYNDTYGHLAGDNCLKQIAKVLEGTIENSIGLAARFGGEEFAIVLPETTQQKAEVIANKVHSAILALQIPHKSSPISPIVTVSIGISTMIPTIFSKPDELFLKTDKALYAAKQKGRNRTVIDANKTEELC
ncbi:GGDEF domain-containing protein [Niallia endozanthoxylica]|uniref:Diguanylate cyclase n=1 Tax=Niallia endozanthoxylica TaxID=2036016 RepID=A0A5J5HPK8_9BACI|nr:diguanylate cyclase [Niallia endozanthoxylica]KAA9021778.1 diguanylate cyclase [Niallia endozanthoxylica]